MPTKKPVVAEAVADEPEVEEHALDQFGRPAGVAGRKEPTPAQIEAAGMNV